MPRGVCCAVCLSSLCLFVSDSLTHSLTHCKTHVSVVTISLPPSLPFSLPSSQDDSSQDISRSWYPPLKHTLSLLSMLYGVVDSTVFEDLARRGVAACIDTLIKGAAGVRRWKNQLHGDFFLVRHLLILREQLLPFDMNLQSIEK
jgi:hypothetical protein